MPVEIKELVIRAVTDSGDDPPGEDEPGAGGSGDEQGENDEEIEIEGMPSKKAKRAEDPGECLTGLDQNAIVEAAVREVLRILKESRTR